MGNQAVNMFILTVEICCFERVWHCFWYFCCWPKAEAWWTSVFYTSALATYSETRVSCLFEWKHKYGHYSLRYTFLLINNFRLGEIHPSAHSLLSFFPPLLALSVDFAVPGFIWALTHIAPTEGSGWYTSIFWHLCQVLILGMQTIIFSAAPSWARLVCGNVE